MKTKIPALLFLAGSLFAEEPIRVCSDHPAALPSYNPDWYYYEFDIPSNTRLETIYGGFVRTSRYSFAEHDYIAQYYQAGFPPANLDDYQLWNYDTIGISMYNTEWDISGLGLLGSGIMRVSAPLTHGVTWNEACVSFVPIDSQEAVPEPGTLVLLVAGGILLPFIIRKRVNQGISH